MQVHSSNALPVRLKRLLREWSGGQAHSRSAPTAGSVTRRGLLTGAAAAAAGAAMPWERLLAATAPGGGDYRALVCVFLYGGSDSHNLLVPRSSAVYAQYATNRGNLALPLKELLPIEPRTSDGLEYGLNPVLPRLKARFEAGQLALLRNVGPLVEPVTKQSYVSKSVALPPQLFSHKDQQHYWQTARQQPGNNVGWGGRLADRMLDQNDSPLLTAISLDGANTYLNGESQGFYSMGSSGPTALTVFNGELGPLRRLAFEALLTSSAAPVPLTYAQLQVQAAGLEALLSAGFAGLPELNTVFPNTPLGQQLRRIALTIAARDALGSKRQVFLAGKSAFDNHSDLIEAYPALLGDVDASLEAFQAALEELGVDQDVVTFSASDFGRSLSSNGKGSDHGWGGHALILGTPVLGGDLYGTMPELALDGPDDVGAGRLIPSTSVDRYGATLARWFGVTEAELPAVFPNLPNFPGGPLGFLG
jgi:uncharacterized protein (DUF1501 family)